MKNKHDGDEIVFRILGEQPGASHVFGRFECDGFAVRRKLDEFLREVVVARLEKIDWERRMDAEFERRVKAALGAATSGLERAAEVAVKDALAKKVTLAVADQYEVKVSVSLEHKGVTS